MGRLDHLVELVYDRFVNRYFAGESVSTVFSLAVNDLIPCFEPRGLRRCRRREILCSYNKGLPS